MWTVEVLDVHMRGAAHFVDCVQRFADGGRRPEEEAG